MGRYDSDREEYWDGVTDEEDWSSSDGGVSDLEGNDCEEYIDNNI